MTVLAFRYSFEVPDGWKNEVVGKVSCIYLLLLHLCTGCSYRQPYHSTMHVQVEKGMQGIDTRVTNPKAKCALLIAELRFI